MDPLVAIVLGLCFSLLWMTAAIGKVSDLRKFVATLGSYRLIPTVLIAPAGVLIAAVEIVLAALWLVPSFRLLAAGASAVLLGVYALAMGINLLRGRAHISCGCSKDELPLSFSLVIRNVVFAGVALALAFPLSGRGLGWVDVLFGAVLLVAILVIERAAATLVANASQMAAWRR